MTHHPLSIRFAPDIEVRSDARTVCGVIVPFDTWTQISDFEGRYDERVDRGAFDRTIRERGPAKVKFMLQHRHDELPIGRATLLRPEARGLYGEFRVSRTEKGDEALELIKDGALDSLSMGFRPIRQNWSADRRQRTILEARLDECSIVNEGAYAGALIEAVRSQLTPQLAAARRRLLELRMDPPT